MQSMFPLAGCGGMAGTCVYLPSDPWVSVLLPVFVGGESLDSVWVTARSPHSSLYRTFEESVCESR